MDNIRCAVLDRCRSSIVDADRRSSMSKIDVDVDHRCRLSKINIDVDHRCRSSIVDADHNNNVVHHVLSK